MGEDAKEIGCVGLLARWLGLLLAMVVGGQVLVVWPALTVMRRLEQLEAAIVLGDPSVLEERIPLWPWVEPAWRARMEVLDEQD